MNKSGTKSGFIIKLSSETAQKLAETTRDVELSAPKIPCSDISETNQTDKNNEIVKEKNLIDGEKCIKKTETEKCSNESEHGNISQNSEPKNDYDEGENVTTENLMKNEVVHKNQDEKSWGEYAPYITYESNEAVYTDPTTNVKYLWSSETNTWIDKSSEAKCEIPGRVYSYEDDTHIYTEPDGSKFFWDVEKKAWIPKVDDDFLAYYQMSYGFVENTQSTIEDSDGLEKEKDQEKKPKESAQIGAKRKQEPQWFEASDDTNTKVYVSNLPLDLSEEEFVTLMQKCGLVMRDPSNQKMKIKFYMDKEHNCFKGDALCTYIKIESVDLALKILDGSDYKGHKIKVERAHFQLKGEYNPALKPKKKKKKELEKIKRIQEKLFDWRPEKMLGERAKHEKVVIIKNLFDPTDFDKEVQLILDYQQDLREECSKCGEVRKVIIYDRHPEGVAQVTMKEPEQADAVIQLINGRWFGKRKISAEIWDGRTKYKIAETDADINKRINKWEKFLEQDEGGVNNKNDAKTGTSNEDLKCENDKHSKIEIVKCLELESKDVSNESVNK
ncbi:HIV Tat-specific factor 1 [Eumeta japonica]|uniref:17S U2 SnRNP complex component HTATSF1 n=1 Tax=Eumeta variegata TaxID=151549 RepID=A0A4C1U9T1_EUMVA|nr:HIV Tat-specific factor 1 [Eumeta japonica]